MKIDLETKLGNRERTNELKRLCRESNSWTLELTGFGRHLLTVGMGENGRLVTRNLPKSFIRWANSL